MEEYVFYYDEVRDQIRSLTMYHMTELDPGSLAEAHPQSIYFYANVVGV